MQYPHPTSVQGVYSEINEEEIGQERGGGGTGVRLSQYHVPFYFGK